MIELTLEQLLNSVESLKQLSTKPLKARVAFIIAKIIKEADVEVNNFNDARVGLINKYGQKNDDGSLKVDENNNVQLEPEKITEFNKELSELVNTKINLNANKLTVEDIESLEFTPAEVIVLEPFVEI